MKAGRIPYTRTVLGMLLIAVSLLFIWLSLGYVEQSRSISEASPDPGGIPLRWLVKSLIPLGYGLLVYGMAWISGLGAFAPGDYAAWAGKMLGNPQWPPAAHVVLMVALQVTAGFALSCASALGEEIARLLAPLL